MYQSTVQNCINYLLFDINSIAAYDHYAFRGSSNDVLIHMLWNM